MPRLPDFNPIDYLIKKKYPLVRMIENKFWGDSKISYDDRERLENDLKAYREELEAKSQDEINKLYSIEKEKEQHLMKLKANSEEKQLFFNQPSATADFLHWSKMPYWTLDEAISLSFGKKPQLVTWDKIKSYIAVSPFVVKYAQTRDLALRAKGCKQLDDSVWPNSFIMWIKRNDLEFPKELENLIEAQSGKVVAWKSLHDNLKQSYDGFKKDYDEYVILAQKVITGRDDQIAYLTQQIESLQKKLVEKEQASCTPPTKERDSMLKIIYGLAKARYNYNPSAARNEATSQIKLALEKVEIPIDEGTILKYLKQGAELFEN